MRVPAVLSIAASVFLFGLLGWVGYVHHSVVTSGAYEQALVLAKSSPSVQAALGDGIRVQEPVFGYTSTTAGSQFVQFSAPLVGSRGAGHLYGVANSIHGLAEFSRLSLQVDHTGRKINLAPGPRLLSLPPVPAKRVYLIPMGFDSDESLDWAPAYYRAKLGIDVELLPGGALPRGVEDGGRHQIDSERLVEYLCNRYKDLAQDPYNILIAVTSRDMFIPSFGWAYAENFREAGRYAVVSYARLQPPGFLARMNPEWVHSRFQKMLTKNIAILYFDLPMSSDYTSLLSGGVLSGREVDLISGSIIGGEGVWDPFIEPGELEVTVYVVPGKPLLWKLVGVRESPTSAPVFNPDISLGLFAYRKTDFSFEGDYPLHFTRAYRNQDDRSRPFGIGANDSLDIFLVGKMGSYIDLVTEDGGRVHFRHSFSTLWKRGDVYETDGTSFSRAVFADNLWTVERRDGWKFYFPYKPNLVGPNVTILTGFADPSGHRYEMNRDGSGDLVSVTTPDGRWLQFEEDAQHRIRFITDSAGRFVRYDYDSAGCLVQTTDSEGHQERYTYDNRAQMLSVTLGDGPPVLTNTYDEFDTLTSQTLADGQEFQYHYRTAPGSKERLPDFIVTPNGLLSRIVQYDSYSYGRSLPVAPRR